ncbi:MAG: apolipoprotein N-acyltransferase [Thermoflexibacter sp.]|nr:apolipoprotein N-acyltransferase [Thermoflexibacter sp.]
MRTFLQNISSKSYYLLLLAVCCGLLAGLSWYKYSFWLIFFAFIPLLAIEKYITENSGKYKKPLWKLWSLSYLAMLIWNITATWWIWNSTIGGSIAAFVANSALMTIPVLLFYWIKKYSKDRFGYLAFIVCWIAFEYVHLHWSLSWVWLLIGNPFGFMPAWVQWYEYTGIFGGAIWVLWINVLIFNYLFKNKKLTPALIVLILPLLFSYYLYFAYEEKGKEVEIVVVQPNLDCYTEKFTYNANTGETNTTSFVQYHEQVNRYFQLSQTQLTPNTALVAFPETSLHEAFPEQDVLRVEAVQRMMQLQQQYPVLSFLSGADSYVIYDSPDATPTTRNANGMFYDYFNMAIFVGNQEKTYNDPIFKGDDGKIALYHKSKLVIGVETNPLRDIFKLFGRAFMINLGGIAGDLGIQEEREAFFNKDSVGFAPVICYESIYGEYVTEYIQKGANIICIITNDGWWGNTSGHVQHLAHASLRAIETRRSIARAANTGISGFINQRGDIIQVSKYNEMIALRNKVKANKETRTFYVQMGDYIARVCTFLAFFMLVAALVKNRLLKKVKI